MAKKSRRLKPAVHSESDAPEPAIIYQDWFDQPEGKEGGSAFAEKRTPRFWAPRDREVGMRAQLLDEKEGD